MSDWLGIALLFAAGLLLMLVPKLPRIIKERRLRHHLADMWVHLGTSLVIAALAIALVERRLADEIHKEITGATEGRVLHNLAGQDTSVVAAILRQIAGPPFRYRKYDIRANVERRIAEGDTFVSYTAITEIWVENTGSRPAPFLFSPFARSERRREPCAEFVEFPSIRILSISDNPTPIGEDLITASDRDSADSTATGVALRVVKELQPGRLYEARWAARYNDDIVAESAHHTKYLSSGMTLQLQYDPSILSVDVGWLYPEYYGETLLGSVFYDSGSARIAQQERLITRKFQIARALLPWQGIVVQWHPSESESVLKAK